MLTIRLFRVGKKNQPAYKIVVTDKRNAASRGRFVEEVGFYDPLTKQRNLKGDRVKYWLGQGAKTSDTVHNMLITDKVIEASKLPKHKIMPPKAEETTESASSADQAPKAETAPEQPTAKPEPTGAETKETPKEQEKPAEFAPKQSTDEAEKKEDVLSESASPAEKDEKKPA
jgi:small subunit ribosomal protein S16